VHGKPQRGSPTPHGAEACASGVNFAVFSSTASALSLVLCTREDHAAGRVTAEVVLDPVLNRTARARAPRCSLLSRPHSRPGTAALQGSTWHVLLPSLSPSLLYGFRVSDAPTILLDPCACGVVSRPTFAQPGMGGDCWPQMLATLPDGAAAPFDWEGTSSPNRSLEDLVIYECHVRGFTRHPSSGAAQLRAAAQA
jgi:isoamylase